MGESTSSKRVVMAFPKFIFHANDDQTDRFCWTSLDRIYSKLFLSRYFPRLPPCVVHGPDITPRWPGLPFHAIKSEAYKMKNCCVVEIICSKIWCWIEKLIQFTKSCIYTSPKYMLCANSVQWFTCRNFLKPTSQIFVSKTRTNNWKSNLWTITLLSLF